MRRAAAIVCASFLPLLAAPDARAHTPSGSVVVITVDGTDLDDWRRAGVPEIDALFTEGAAALLSARTAAPPAGSLSECTARGQAALRTMLEGRPAGGGEIEERDTTLSRAITSHGLFLGIARGTIPDASFPGGNRANIPIFLRAMTRGPSVAVFPVIDTLAADCRTSGEERNRWVDLSLRRVAPLVAAARATGDQVILASTVPPIASERTGNYLAVIAITGGPKSGGTLRSATTHRDGVVTLSDVAATIVRIYRIDGRAGVGSPMRGAGTANLQRLDDRYSHAVAMRAPLVRALAVAGSTLLLGGLLMILSGRGLAGDGRLPKTPRDAIAFLLCAVAAVPAATLVEGIANTDSPIVTTVLIAGVALLLSFYGFAAGGVRGALAVVGAATLVIVTADAVLQGALSSKGVLSSGVAQGVRFFGHENAMLGALVAGTLIWTGGSLDSAPRAARGIVAILGVAVVTAALPSAGARAELILVTLIAFGFLALRSERILPDRFSGLGIAIGTVLASGIAAAISRSRAPGTLEGLSVQQAGGWVWVVPVVVATGIVVLLGARRRALLARGLWGKPHLRFALAACAVAAAVALGTDKAGTVTAGSIALIAGGTLIATFLAGDARGP